jgi:pyruvate dehydrogenase E1 component beta subunit
MVMETLAAAEQLATAGISCEVIDVATLNPLDADTILASVEKTGRAVIVEEAPHHGGFGAVIAALLAEQGLLSLRAPVRRVAGFDTIMPMPRLEHCYMPDTDSVIAAVRETLEFN